MRSQSNPASLVAPSHSHATPQGKASNYGCAYIMEIKDTVVEGVEGASEGSLEFLVFTKALTKAAAAAGLHPVRVESLVRGGCGVSQGPPV